MTNNRGTQLLNIPIRFRAYSLQPDWEIVRTKAETVFEGSLPTLVALKSENLGDEWELVRRFLRLDSADDSAILNFLMAYGEFKSPIDPEWERAAVAPTPDKGHKGSKGPSVLAVERIAKPDFASLQGYLRQMLLSADPTLRPPWGRDSTPQYEYSIRFTKTRAGLQAEVTVSGVFPSMLATVQFKVLQGATFKTCSRKDCRLPFEVTSRHKRKFCTQYCAHITSLRSRRKIQRTRKENTPGSLQSEGR